MVKKLTYEEVKDVFESKGNKLVSTEYHGNKVPLEYICDCGKKDKKTIGNFRSGQRCKECGDKKTGNGLRMKEEDVKKIFEDNCCILISDYINAQIPLEFICSCGGKGKTRIREFSNGSRCHDCNVKKRVGTNQKNNNYAKQYQDMFASEGYQILEPYIGAGKNIMVRCPKGHETSMKPSNFKTGYRCGECSPKRKKTYEEVKAYFEKEDYLMRSTEYIEAFSKLDVTCPKGHETEISWDNFRAGKRCRSCNESKGEKRVEEYLIHHKLIYKDQFKFDDCKYRRKLPFDFAIFDENKHIVCLIEYDGEFHHIATEMTGGEEGLKAVQKRDKIKTNYCLKNNIPLIRIHYWEFDLIEEILDEKLLPLIEQKEIKILT